MMMMMMVYSIITTIVIIASSELLADLVVTYILHEYCTGSIYLKYYSKLLRNILEKMVI
jgi:hypothetical protein